MTEIENSMDRLEAQCGEVMKACQDRRPKKAFTLFVCFTFLVLHVE